MPAWIKVGLLVAVCAATALGAGAQAPSATWRPLLQAAPSEHALFAAHVAGLNRLLDLYNYPPLDPSWQVAVLDTPALRRHVVFELTRPQAEVVIVADATGTELRLLPLLQDGQALPHVQENLHNLALFNAVLADEPGPASSDAAWAGRAGLYLLLTGVPEPLPVAVALPAPRPGESALRRGAWQFTFDSHGLLIGFHRVPFAAAVGGR